MSTVWSEEVHFGPPSDPICLQSFYDHALRSQDTGNWPWLDFVSSGTSANDASKAIEGWEPLNSIPDEEKTDIFEDCDTMDIAAPLSGILASSKLVSLVQSMHADAVSEVKSHSKAPKKKANKKVKNHGDTDDPTFEALKESINNNNLSMWKLESTAFPFIRDGFEADKNTLITPQFTQLASTNIGIKPISRDILLTVTMYTRMKWHPFRFARDSQYILPSTSTLADIWRSMPCRFRCPEKKSSGIEACQAVGQSKSSQGSMGIDYDSTVMVIEDVAYCDGKGSPDYADMLIQHLNLLPRQNVGKMRQSSCEGLKHQKDLHKGPPLHTVTLRSLSLRINQPYWVLHHGKCEHWLVIDEIRLQNPGDPVTGYPICVQRSPVNWPTCKTCSRLPATLSIVNDIRLGESPVLLCSPCWDLVGFPGEAFRDNIIVTPLPYARQQIKNEASLT